MAKARSLIISYKQQTLQSTKEINARMQIVGAGKDSHSTGQDGDAMLYA